MLELPDPALGWVPRRHRWTKIPARTVAGAIVTWNSGRSWHCVAPTFGPIFPSSKHGSTCKELKDSPSDILPGFNERLMAWLPTMIEHRCGSASGAAFSSGCAAAPTRATSSSTSRSSCRPWPACRVGFGRARETSEDGVYKVAIEYQRRRAWPGVPGNRPPAARRRGARPAVRRRGRSRQAARSGPAGLPRPQHRRDRACGRQAWHSGPPAEFRKPGATWLRCPATAHPGRPNRSHRRRRRSDRPGQGTDPLAAALDGRAGVRRPAGDRRRRRLGGGPGDRQRRSSSSRNTAAKAAA